VRVGIARLRPLLAAALLPLMLAGCKKSKDEPKGLGEQMRDVEVDTQVMRDAQGAVNEVIRASSDCELAKPAIAAANMKLDEAARNIRTAAGNNSLNTMRKQVQTAQDLCP
jgi:nitrous oxide reductase accessory protein NosL